MAREIMFVIRHGVMKKVWIDPKDIYNESDVPFVAPDYPTKEMIAEKEKRLAEKAAAREAEMKRRQHDDWNEPKVEPRVKPIAKEVKEPKAEPETAKAAKAVKTAKKRGRPRK